MIGKLNTLELWAGITIFTGFRYLFLASIAWVLCYWLFHGKWFHRKIIQKRPGAEDIRREIFYSLLSVLIFGVVGLCTILAGRMGWNQLYWKIGDHSWVWFGASVVLTIFIHDTYFYWTHRWMHHPKLYRKMHLVHHQSKNPTPWASFAFGPWEAVVQAGIFPLATFLIPIHPLAFGIFMGWQMFNNVLGHSGFEFYPNGFMNRKIRFFLNTPTNHIMHHEKPYGNYGLYFNFWDRWMGTNQKDYESRFKQVTQKRPTSAPLADTKKPVPADTELA